MKCSMKLAGLSGVFLMSGIASAQSVTSTATATRMSPASFNNHLHSPLLVSPAQYYQVEGGTADFSAGFLSGTLSSDDVDSDVTASVIRATGLYSIGYTGLKAGLDVAFTDSLIQQDEIENSEIESTSQDYTVAPVIVYDMGPFVVGAQATFIQLDGEVEEKNSGVTQAETDSGYMRHTFAAAYKVTDVEGGISYTTAKDDENAGIQDPAELSLHGRVKAANDLAFGGIVSNAAFSSLDGEVGNALKDRLSVFGTAEWTMPSALHLEGLVGYNASYFDGSENMSSGNIATWEALIGADYLVNRRASVGGQVNYETGSDSANDRDVSLDTLAVAVRGNIMF